MTMSNVDMPISNVDVSVSLCPPVFGLSQLEGYCQCDPILASTRIISVTCNIDDQTILHPGNSWICTTSNYTYRVASHCPFHYCLPNRHLIFLILTLSASSKGLVCYVENAKKVSALFLVPLTVDHALMYFYLQQHQLHWVVLYYYWYCLCLTWQLPMELSTPLSYYVNIVSINSSILFTHQSTAHIFVSLAKLDLGFEMCFYDGMDDYIKIWLQLAFPVYLIIIAMLLIIGSRYSTKVQRLTARRAVAVLATLFLLSCIAYCVLCLILSFYNHGPSYSNKTTMVWSVDANVSFFGAKFIVLFTACLILLVIIIPFNVVLIFTRISIIYSC